MRVHRFAVVLAFAAIATSCRRPVVTTPEVLPAEWNHCWWTAIRSTLPADTVASRFRRAMITVGMPGFRLTRSADTVWMRGGPAPIARDERDGPGFAGAQWARVVLFRHADSTHFMMYVATVPSAQAWTTADSSSATRHQFAMCEAIARESGVKWLRRAGDPGDEEKLPVWSRVP